jgi:protein-tyrosine phosphatase
MDHAIATMADDGFDLSSHRSRKVRSQMVVESDLVVAMTRQHVVDLLLLAPDSWNRVFQLRDLVRRGEQVGRRSKRQPINAWLGAVGADRTKSGVLAGRLADDIVDPVGHDRPVYDKTKDLLNDLLTRLAGLLG